MPSDANERWSQLAALFAVPEFMTDAPKLEADAGQLRQASWAHADAMVLIDQIDDEAALAHVYPVSVDPATGGRAEFVVDASKNPLSTALNVWPKHAHWIPFASLDELLATIDPAIVDALRAAAERTSASSFANSSTSPTQVVEGSAVDELLDAVSSLEEAPRLERPVGSSPSVRLDIDLGVVIDALGVTQSRAMNILSGTEPISGDEAGQLSAETGVPIATILAATSPLPAELERELQEPRWRASIRIRAAGGDEQAGRLRLGYDVYQLAARQTGAGRELWRRRIDTFLASEAR